MIAVLYLVFPVLTLIIWLLAKDVKLPEAIKAQGIEKELLKVAFFIYTAVRSRRKVKGLDSVRASLTALTHKKNIEEIEAAYYSQKLCLFITMALAGSFLAGVLHFSALNERAVGDNGVIARSESGGGDQTLLLEARDEKGEKLGDFEVTVSEQVYTREEADRLFDEASALVEEKVFAANESPDHVTENLNLIKKLEGYPFEISWQQDNYEVVGFDGDVHGEEASEDGQLVTLTATYRYDGQTWQQILYANVFPRELTEKQLWEKEINEKLTEAEVKSRYNPNLILPGSYEGGHLSWSERVEENSLILMILMLLGGAAVFVMKDKELQKQVEDRRLQMLADYPGFVSKLVLYMGAGMTVRSIFEKMTKDYLSGRRAGGQERFMYEELARTVREISGGVSEVQGYENFGRRCGGQQYTRLSALLSQNIRKGNSELLSLLREESDKAFEDRLSKAQKAGEEAGTKLLLPMILMLLIVMIIIMIPAYMTF